MPPTHQPDLLALLAVLSRHEVDYVLVGGMAALVYGATRLTEDLDIVARDMDDNMERLASALNELDAHSDIAEKASVFELRAMNTGGSHRQGPWMYWSARRDQRHRRSTGARSDHQPRPSSTRAMSCTSPR